MRTTVKKLVTVVSCAIAGMAMAADYSWVGGASTSWNTSSNWSPSGVPGAGDTATFTSDATINDGIVTEGGQLRIVANGAAVTLDGVISGSGSMYFETLSADGSCISITAANTYSGGTALHHLGSGIYLQNEQCFGSSRAVTNTYGGAGSLYFDVENAWFEYDFTQYCANASDRSANAAFFFKKSGTLDGSITATGSYNGQIKLEDVTGNVNFVITGRVFTQVGGGGVFVVSRKSTVGDGIGVQVLGGITSWSVSADTTGDGKSTGRFMLGGSTYLGTGKINLGYGLTMVLTGENIFSLKIPYLNFVTYSDGEKGSVDLNGTAQEFDRLVTPAAHFTGSGECWQIRSTEYAVMTLKATSSSLSNCSSIRGAVSVVLDADSSDIVQAFTGRVSPTTGSLTATKGVIRIASDASFPNARALVAQDGGTIDILSTVENGLAGVEEITIEDGGVVNVGSSTTLFGSNTIDLNLETGAELNLAEGAVITVRSMTYDGMPVSPGTLDKAVYTAVKGAGNIVVAQNAASNATGWWTSFGGSTSTYDYGNWEGGYPGTDKTAYFARYGAEVELAGDLVVKGVSFLTTDAMSDFTVSSKTGSERIVVTEGLFMTNTAATIVHTNTISAPVSLADGAAIRVDGDRNALKLAGEYTSAGSVRVDSGTGSLLLADMPAAGTFNVVNGQVALAGTGTGTGKFNLNPGSAGNIAFHLLGGTYGGGFEVLRCSTGPIAFTFDEGTTSVLNGQFKLQNSNTMYVDFAEDASATFNGRVLMSWAYDYRLMYRLQPGASLTFNSNHVIAASANVRFRMPYDSDKRSQVTMNGIGTKAPKGMIFCGPIDVTMGRDYVFDTVEGVNTPWYLWRVHNDGVTAYWRPVVIDLNGHSQRIGDLGTVPSDKDEIGYESERGRSFTSSITSATAADLHVVQVTTTDRPWVSMLQGGVSLVKEGEGTLTFGNVNSTTGRLAVCSGTVAFADQHQDGTPNLHKGSFPSVSEVAVSGGVLVVDSADRLPAKTVYRLSGGKLDLAEGVTLEASELYVPDGNSGWTRLSGSFNSSNLSQYITGEGSINVIAGTMLLFR